MKDRILWIVFAVLSFALLILLSIPIQGDWEVYFKGKLVVVTITSLPNDHSPTDFMNFKMGNQIFDKRVSAGISKNLHVGEKISLKYLKGYEDFFLFPNENPIFGGICAILIFSFLGIAFLYYALKREPVPFRLPFIKKRTSRI